jgi:hypothetical protein
MKKGINKKVLVLSLVLFVLITLSFVSMVAAVDNTPVPRDTAAGNPEISNGGSFFDRWTSGLIEDRDAKILVWFLTTIILFLILYSVLDGAGLAFFVSIPAGFILSAFVTPASVIGIIKSYDTLPVVFLTFLPLGILFMITYTTVIKGKRTLMTASWLLWTIYFIYISMKIIAFVGLQDISQLGWVAWFLSLIPKVLSYAFPTYALQTFVQTIPTEGTQEFVWYWASLIISFLVSFFMAFFPGWFMNFAMRRTLGIEKAVWKKKMSHVAMGIDTLENIGTRMEGGKPSS